MAIVSRENLKSRLPEGVVTEDELIDLLDSVVFKDEMPTRFENDNLIIDSGLVVTGPAIFEKHIRIGNDPALSNPMGGEIRYDANTGNSQIYDAVGASWLSLTGIS